MTDPIAVSRRLVAVFAADVEGYSRLMGADEVGTLKGLTERRAILDILIADHHRGRIANTAGDGVFAEFGSPPDEHVISVSADGLSRDCRLQVCKKVPRFFHPPPAWSVWSFGGRCDRAARTPQQLPIGEITASVTYDVLPMAHFDRRRCRSRACSNA
jgi:class 3 adenylate cyclase